MSRYRPITADAGPLLKPSADKKPDIVTPKTPADDDNPALPGRTRVPAPDSIGTSQVLSSDNWIKKAVGIGAGVIAAGTLAVVIALVLSGLAQDYARKRRYRAGGGAFWGWLAKLPSLRYPKPPFYKVESREYGVTHGCTKLDDLYDLISLTPAVKHNGVIRLVDDWGGWFSFSLDIDGIDYKVVWYDRPRGELGVVDHDCSQSLMSICTSTEAMRYLYMTEQMGV